MQTFTFILHSTVFHLFVGGKRSLYVIATFVLAVWVWTLNLKNGWQVQAIQLTWSWLVGQYFYSRTNEPKLPLGDKEKSWLGWLIKDSNCNLNVWGYINSYVASVAIQSASPHRTIVPLAILIPIKHHAISSIAYQAFATSVNERVQETLLVYIYALSLICT